jgi:hypothetical protein
MNRPGHQRRKRAIGDHKSMRLPDDLRSAVAYVYRNDDLLGTAFLLGAPGEKDGMTYVLTAGHLVLNRDGIRLRVNTVDGGFGWVPIEQDAWWELHNPHVDLAAALWPIRNAERFQVTIIPFEHLLDNEFATRNDIGPGDEVAFIGLFQRAPGEDRNLPIVRFGHVARMADELHDQEWPGGILKKVEAVLVEARSWGGHSGSPAFLVHSLTRRPGVLEMPEWPVTDPRMLWALMGLVSGHWNLPADVVQKNKPVDDLEPIEEVKVNAGIALVTPAQRIVELLTREDVAVDLAKRREEQRNRDAAEADVAPAVKEPEDESMTRADFEEALKKVSRRKPSPPDEGTSGT